MQLRSGKIYDPMMSTKLRTFMNFDNDLFRTWWDEYADNLNQYTATHCKNPEECYVYFKEQFKLLKKKIQTHIEETNP